MTDPVQPNIDELVNTFLAEQASAYAASSGSMTFLTSVQAFLSSADWIGPEHMPSVVSLHSLAKQLDMGVTAALVAQFGVTFRDLRAQSPGSAASTDPMEDDLAKAGR